MILLKFQYFDLLHNFTCSYVKPSLSAITLTCTAVPAWRKWMPPPSRRICLPLVTCQPLMPASFDTWIEERGREGGNGREGGKGKKERGKVCSTNSHVLNTTIPTIDKQVSLTLIPICWQRRADVCCGRPFPSWVWGIHWSVVQWEYCGL